MALRASICTLWWCKEGEEQRQALYTHICTLWWCGEGLRRRSGLASKHLFAHCNGVGRETGAAVALHARAPTCTLVWLDRCSRSRAACSSAPPWVCGPWCPWPTMEGTRQVNRAPHRMGHVTCTWPDTSTSSITPVHKSTHTHTHTQSTHKAHMVSTHTHKMHGVHKSTHGEHTHTQNAWCAQEHAW